MRDSLTHISGRSLLRSLLALALTLCLLLSGCAAGGPVGRNHLEEQEMSDQVQLPETAREGATQFALALLQASAGEGNKVVSPLSAYIALAMAATGAEGETLSELEQVLGGRLEDVLSHCAALTDALGMDNEDGTIALANALWANEQYAIRQEYAQALADSFNAQAYSAPLATTETQEAVNQWVREQTRDMIPEFLEKPLDGDAALLLLNALYLKCSWERTFSSYDTQDLEFTLDDGSVITVPTMTQTKNLSVAQLPDGGAAVVLSYVGTEVKFLAILPPEGMTAAAYVQQFTPEVMEQCLAAEETYTALYLPRFSLETGGELKETLQQMGLHLAFTMEADFSPMAESGADELYIGSVLQKAKIQVGEKGTEAAAATAVEMLVKGALRPMQQEPLELRFDRSFLFAVVEPNSGMPLFSGIVASPEE